MQKIPRPVIEHRNFDYMVYALSLSCPGRKPDSIFSIKKLASQTHLVYHKDSSNE